MMLITLIFGFISLLPVAIKTNKVSTLFKNPAFVIGDFVLLPMASGVMTYFYEIQWSWQVFIIALLITFMAGIKYKLLNIWWVPHGLFYLFFLYLLLGFMLDALSQILRGDNIERALVALILVVGCVALHQILGAKFPKVFN